MKGSSAAHSALVNAILVALGALPGVVIGVNASGRAKYVSERGRVHVVPYGLLAPGGPDIVAFVAPLGRAVCFEAKTGKARLTRDQRAVHAALRAVGVAVHVVRSVDDARAALRDAQGTAVKKTSIHADLTHVPGKNDDLRRGQASKQQQGFTP